MEPLRRLSETEAARRAESLAKGFRDFAFKGNVIALAVGVILGAAFTKLIDALVKSIIMPVIGLIMPGDQGYVGWKLVLRGQEVPFGQFLGELVNFLIVAFVLYLVAVKFLGRLVGNEPQPGPPPPSKEELLLTEIRDLLKQQKSLEIANPAPREVTRPVDRPENAT